MLKAFLSKLHFSVYSYIYLFIWKILSRKKKNHAPADSLLKHQEQLKVNQSAARTQEFLLGPPVELRDVSTWAILCCFTECSPTGSCVSNKLVQIWNVGFPGWGLTRDTSAPSPVLCFLRTVLFFLLLIQKLPPALCSSVSLVLGYGAGPSEPAHPFHNHLNSQPFLSLPHQPWPCQDNLSWMMTVPLLYPSVLVACICILPKLLLILRFSAESWKWGTLF